MRPAAPSRHQTIKMDGKTRPSSGAGTRDESGKANSLNSLRYYIAQGRTPPRLGSRICDARPGRSELQPVGFAGTCRRKTRQHDVQSGDHVGHGRSIRGRRKHGHASHRHEPGGSIATGAALAGSSRNKARQPSGMAGFHRPADHLGHELAVVECVLGVCLGPAGGLVRLGLPPWHRRR